MTAAPGLAPTPEQRRAADPSLSVWVTANAGTGKTRVLSDRVLRLLLAGARPESILCLTFTRAAAAEMTERIEKRLAAWAVEPDDRQLAADIEALVGCPVDSPTLMRARRLFASVLDLPRGLPVTTIHAFAAELLSLFPLEAGVSPHFEVLDPRTRAELDLEARSQVLESVRRARGQGRLAEAIQRLAVWVGERGFGEALHTILEDRLALLAAWARHGGEEGLLEAIRKALDVPLDEREPVEIVAEAAERADFDAPALRAAAEELLRSTTASDQERGRAILAWLEGQFADPIEAFHAYRRAFLTEEGKDRRRLGTKAISAASLRTLAREQARLLRVEERIRCLLAFRRSEALLRVGHALVEAGERLRARRAALDFDDLVERARRLLDSAVDWVRFKLDARIDHILVDEAQDTSPAQWAIVEKLAEEFFSGEGAKEGPRTLFVVGDEKQSIYGFQGADLATFRAVRARIRQRAQAAGIPFAEVSLTRSFRSTEAVLRLVDAVFARPEARSGVLCAGEALRHDTVRRGEPGLVELWPLAENEEEPSADRSWPLPDEVRARPEAEAQVATAIVRTVRGWLQGGEILESRGRPIAPGDIMVLVRRRGTIQERIVRGLEAAGVPVAGIDRLTLAEHLAVADLLALGRVMLLPEDDYSLACLLKSPLVGLDEEQLFELAHGRGQTSLMERLRARGRRDAPDGPFAQALRRLEEWLRRADFMPPFEFYGWVLGADGGRRRLLERLGPEAEEPIEAFLGQTLAYEEGHPASLRGFLHWFELASGELQRDPGRSPDAVQVLTVHGAKGLEAPIVFLADAGPHAEPRRERLLWASLGGNGERLPFWRLAERERPEKLAAACQAERIADTEEDLRLLYVALTRAADRLYITGWKPRREISGVCWHEHVRRALKDLAEVERWPCHLGPGFRGEILRLRCGAATLRPTEEPAVQPPPGTARPPWLHRPAPVESARLSSIAPSARAPEEPPRTPPRGTEERRLFARGAALHRLFELLPRVAAEEREGTALRLLKLLLPEADARSHLSLWQEVERVLTLPELEAAFAPEARAEQPLCGEIDGVPVVGQVDRFVVRDDEVLLVDFKSHLDPPDRQAIPPAYRRQLELYGQLLKRLYPGRRIRAALVWTAIPRVDLFDLGQGEDRKDGLLLPSSSAAWDGAAAASNAERHPR
ncbi:ATP-dependent helicase/nuclease subunit A [bacterium HR40]|nr:ATP-dependent helicase/nuclease subunit A [bacterium HR40]